MLPGIYSAANGMESAQRQQGVTARNLAHAQMPGFRRLIPFHLTPEGETPNSVSGAAGPDGYSSAEAIDFTPGPMQRSGEPFDLAISGDGFFTVQGPEGPLYTRNGVFQLNSEGILVTTDGLQVMSEQGTVQFPPGADPKSISVLSDGRVMLGKAELAQLKLITVENPQRFHLEGATLMSLPNDEPTAPAKGTIVQGVRELSNVHPVQELVTMIAVQRQHEAAQRAMSSLSTAIERHTNVAGG